MKPVARIVVLLSAWLLMSMPVLAGAVSLQQLIDDTDDGATLLLEAGTYQGPVVIDRPITLDGQNHAVIDANGRGSVIVVDTDGTFLGKVTMIDIFRALEPNYKKIEPQQKMSMLSADFVFEVARDFNLWMEPTQTIYERANRLKVADVMHIPEKIEYIKEIDILEKALHIYVMGVHQPLIVKNDADKVTGVLRFGDIFEAFRQSLLNRDNR